MFKKFLVGIVCIAFMCSALSAKPGGSSSSSSSRSSSISRPSSSSSRPSSSWGSKPSTSSSKPSSSWGSKPSSTPKPAASKPTTGNSSGWSTKPTAKPTSQASAGSAGGAAAAALNSSRSSSKSRSVDNKVSKAVGTSGTTASSKANAVNSFKSKYADSTKKGGQYTAHYDKEPAARPTHIPQTVGGSNVTVVYNSQYGGYGYMHPTLGTWMMYDMLSDAVMLNAIANQHHHVTPIASTGHTAVVHSDNGSAMCFLIFVGLLAAMVFFGLVIAFSRRES
jgi:hypothetical protein